MNPIGVGAIAAALAFAIGTGAGVKLSADHYAAKEAKKLKDASDAYEARTEELNAVSAELERAKSEKQVIYRTITKRVQTYIDRPVYLHDCVDDDGLRDINAALAGADPGKPAAAVPATDAARRKDGR
jgi:hypothetical protein